tara:strand:- start:593 stop:937 length:345 start_codon:yes stop_codon:yes gene_type:complete
LQGYIFQAQKNPLLAGFSAFGLSLLLEAAETLVEAIDTTTSINNFLLTSVERVASGAHVQVHSAWLSGFSVDYVAAGTGCYQLSVFWVNTFFHWTPLSLRAAAWGTSSGTALPG